MLLAAAGITVGTLLQTTKAAASPGVVSPGATLTAGQAPITSANGDYRLLVTANGQLTEQSVHSVYPIYQVQYDPSDSPTFGGVNGSIYGPVDTVQIWQRPLTGTSAGARAVMQSDGNLVLYSTSNQVLWASGTVGNPGAHLVVQGDANIVIYSSAGRALWQSGTVSTLDADPPGAHLRMCPWQAGFGVVGFTCPVLATVPNTVGVTMLCWLSAYTPPGYGNYDTNKWFYVSVDGGSQDGFVNASLVTTASQISTPACQMTGKPTQEPTGGSSSAPSSGGSGSPGGPAAGGGGSVSLAQGPPAPSGYRYAITLSGYAPRIAVSIECFDSVSPGGFYSFSLTTGPNGSAYTDDECYSADGPQHWVRAGGVTSNKVSWSNSGTSPTPASTPTSAPPPPPPTTFAETVGGVTHTWTDYSDAGGTEGPSIPAYETVQITCKLTGFKVADGNTWWYRIASSPWSNAYYASADAFYNNGQTTGPLQGTPFVDPQVPNC